MQRLMMHRLWSERSVRLNTKIQMYRTVVLSTLLYGSETWTTYRPCLKNLEQFHMRCLRKICGVTWKDKFPNIKILRHCNITNVESIIVLSQLGWSGHVALMVDDRIPRALFFGQLEECRWSGRGQSGAKTSSKETLKACNIDPTTWIAEAVNRSRWR